MKRVYMRCDWGHYFTGTHCPFDGWTSAHAHALTRALAEVKGQPSFEALQDLAVPKEALQRLVIVDFWDEEGAYDALAVLGYSKDGVYVPVDQRFFESK